MPTRQPLPDNYRAERFEMLRARESFFAAEQYVPEGQEFDESDPIVKGREALFDAIEDDSKPAPKKRASRKS